MTSKIDFVPEGYKPKNTIEVSLNFSESDGYRDCTLCYDDIPVAYIDETGGLRTLAFETGWEDADADDSKDVEYLKSKGVSLAKKKHPWKEGGFVYSVFVSGVKNA